MQVGCATLSLPLALTDHGRRDRDQKTCIVSMSGSSRKSGPEYLQRKSWWKPESRAYFRLVEE
jgi:hypothetical protein